MGFGRGQQHALHAIRLCTQQLFGPRVVCPTFKALSQRCLINEALDPGSFMLLGLALLYLNSPFPKDLAHEVALGPRLFLFGSLYLQAKCVKNPSEQALTLLCRASLVKAVVSFTPLLKLPLPCEQTKKQKCLIAVTYLRLSGIYAALLSFMPPLLEQAKCSSH
jgi:hypothetical protein